MTRRTETDAKALRVFLMAAAMTFLFAIQQGCGAAHVGEPIGIDPLPTDLATATVTATATPTTL